MLEKKKPIGEEERRVLDYLYQHPDFFSRHPEVLEALYLPHKSGSAVSLVEKQLSVLRERNTELRTRLNTLMERSRTNDALFGKSRQLVLRLIAAPDAGAIITVLLNSFRDDFQVEFASLSLLDTPPLAKGLNVLSEADARDKLLTILDSDEAVCGVLRSQQLIALFGDDARLVGSAVALRLAVGGHVYGVLALGNRDSHYYHSGMDTLFPRFIADILNQLLYPRL